MCQKLHDFLMAHAGGVPADADTEMLFEALEWYVRGLEKQVQDLTDCLAETRDCVLEALKHLDEDGYDKWVGPCVGSPYEIPGAAEALRDLVVVV